MYFSGFMNIRGQHRFSLFPRIRADVADAEASNSCASHALRLGLNELSVNFGLMGRTLLVRGAPENGSLASSKGEPPLTSHRTAKK